MADLPLYIYHTNDLHSYLEQWPRIAAYLKEQREWHDKRKENALFFDIGDHADRAHPMTEATRGRGNVQLLNEVGVNHVTIGNNEGMTFSKEDLDGLYDDATFQVLVANLFEKGGNRPAWAAPYDFIELEEGITIGVIGLTIAFHPFYEALGWDIRDPFPMLPELLDKVKAKADIVILLSHLGYPDDEYMAKTFDGIDVILGGHTHHLLKTAKTVNDTLITQCGKNGFYAGQIRLVIDTDTGTIQEKEGGAIDLQYHTQSEETCHLLEEMKRHAKETLMEPIVELNKPLSVSWEEPSAFADLLADGVREWCESEVAMVNAGLLLDSLDTGVVTALDLHRLCPHPINPCVIKVKGSIIKETVHAAFTNKMIHLPLKGFGFRGEKLGRMAFSGMNVDVQEEGGTYEVGSITMNGEPLDPQRTYTMATADMFTFGPLYPGFTHAEDKQYFMPEMMRDILAYKLKKIN